MDEYMLIKKSTLTNIADAIREKKGTTDGIMPENMASDIEAIEAGEDGYNSGYIDGQQSEYDRFWDDYQQNGSRTNYNYGFAGYGWDDKMFKPKYDIRPVAASRLFSDTNIADVKGCLESAGVVLDLSKTTSMAYLIEGATSKITYLPELNVTSVSQLNYFIYQAKSLISIDNVVLKDDGSQTFANTSFGYLNSLEEIRFKGVIGKTINFQWSTKLSVKSLKSIISCLKNYKGTNDDGVNKVTFAEVCWTALEADSSAPDGGTWREYVGNVLGWST